MAQLKYDNLSYFKDRKDLSTKEVKQEYRRLQSVARKRLSNLKEGGFGSTQTVKYYDKVLSQGVSGKTESQLRSMLYDAYNFVSNPNNTLRGFKRRQKETIEKINESMGEDFLNKENFKDFLELINDKAVKDLGLDSDQIVVLASMKAKGLSRESIIKDFDTILQHQEEVIDWLKEHENPERKRKYSSYDLRGILK